MRARPVSPGHWTWLIVMGVVLGVTAWTLWGPIAGDRWHHPQAMFTVTSLAAAICIAMATLVVVLADRREMAEIGLLGTALLTASVMPLLHGLATPGVLFEHTEAFRASMYLALPTAVVVGSPLLVPSTRFGRWAARRWRDWALLTLLAVFVLAAVMAFFPDAISAPEPTDGVTVATSSLIALALVTLSLRQFRFYELGRHRSNLIASLSLGVLGSSALLPMIEAAPSPAFWWLHLTGAIGVLGACVGLASTHAIGRSAQDILSPVLVRDPLAAIELGLSPLVHRFVADLEQKDQATRDHTIRTGELAVRVGERLRLPARDLRNLGLAAMLHDVGKLHVPDEILTKPGRLTAEEYEIVKQHTVHGEQMLLADPTLAGAAPIVRSHHERIDGTGYPDGLAGRDIPLPARIIAACDAFDAMTHDRQFRAAMPVALAQAVLREHAGSQWDPAVVEQVVSVWSTLPEVSALDAVGRFDDQVDLDDLDAAEMAELLSIVDAEI